MKIPCTIKESSIILDSKLMNKRISKLEDGEYTLELTKKEKVRSIHQNALYWRIIKQVEDQSHQDRESIHEFIKGKFLWEPVDGKPFPVIRSTTSLSVSEFKTLIDKMVSFFTSDMEWEIEMPEDK